MATPTPHAALVDGQPVSPVEARLAMTGPDLAGGDGALETVGVWDGRAFRLDAHLARLRRTLHVMALPPVDGDQLGEQVGSLLGGVTGDAVLRVVVTGAGRRVVAVGPLPDRPAPRVLHRVPAPWVQPVGDGGGGPKRRSLGGNLDARRRARAAGADDALLVSVPDGWLLEAATFGLVVVTAAGLHVADPALGIVPSTTVAVLADIAAGHGLPVLEGRHHEELLEEATEVLLCSALRDVLAVAQVDGRRLPSAAPVRQLLSEELWRLRRSVDG